MKKSEELLSIMNLSISSLSAFDECAVLLTEKDIKLILKHRSLYELRYRAALSQLVTLLNTPLVTLSQLSRSEKEELGKQIKDKIRIIRANANKLLYIRTKLIKSKAAETEVRKILTLCEEMMLLLESGKRSFSPEREEDIIWAETGTFSHRIRANTRDWNWARLFFIRLKRVFDALAPLIKSLNTYQVFIKFIDQLNPILSYVAWIYYVPRLLVNLFLFVKHSVPGPWMSVEAKQLGFARVKEEWSRRWFETLNDAVWCLVGVMNCFVLSSPHGMLLIVALYAFDVLMALANAQLHIKKHRTLLRIVARDRKSKEDRLHEIQAKGENYPGEYAAILQRVQQIKLGGEAYLEEYERLVKQLTAIEKKGEEYEGEHARFDKQVKALDNHLVGIHQWIAYEQKRLKQSVVITIGLTGGMVLGALPILLGLALSNPLGLGLSFTAAVVVLTVCIVQYVTSKRIEKTKPNTALKDVDNLKAMLVAEVSSQDEQEQGPDKHSVETTFSPNSGTEHTDPGLPVIKETTKPRFFKSMSMPHLSSNDERHDAFSKRCSTSP